MSDANVNARPIEGPGLLIGGTGMLGTEVRRCLSQRGFRFRLLVRNTVPSEVSPDVIVRGDLEDAESLESATVGARWVVYVPTNSPNIPVHAANIVRAAQAAGVSLLLKTSALLAGESPPESFGIEHREAEDQIADSGMDWIVIRPSVFMQTFQMFSGPMAKQGKLVVPVPTGRTAFIDTRDIAESVSNCLADPGPYQGRRIPITGPEALSMKEVAALFSQASQHPIRHIAPPRFLTKLILRWGEGMTPWMATRLIQLFAALEVGKEGAVSDNLEKILGRKPTRFADFLARDERAQRLWK